MSHADIFWLRVTGAGTYLSKDRKILKIKGIYVMLERIRKNLELEFDKMSRKDSKFDYELLDFIWEDCTVYVKYLKIDKKENGEVIRDVESKTHRTKFDVGKLMW